MNESECLRRALVVEDDVSVRRLVATILRREGFEIVEAKNGREAVAFLGADDRFAIIVLDLVLPEMGGAEVLEHLRRHFPACVRRVVIMTAAVHQRLDGFPEDICVVLRKPFDLDVFVDAVRTCSQ